MYRCSSPQMFLIIEGHGLVMHKNPCSPGFVLVPSSFKTSAWMPGKGKVAQLALIGVAPGKGLMICPPVSVCH
ncbi:hypothetical protein HpEKB16_04380 [Helicobacter pylori]